MIIESVDFKWDGVTTIVESDEGTFLIDRSEGSRNPDSTSDKHLQNTLREALKEYIETNTAYYSTTILELIKDMEEMKDAT